LSAINRKLASYGFLFIAKIRAINKKPYEASFLLMADNKKQHGALTYQSASPQSKYVGCRNLSVVDARLGCPDSTVPESKPTPHSSASRSMFVAQEVTNLGHPRFRYSKLGNLF